MPASVPCPMTVVMPVFGVGTAATLQSTFATNARAPVVTIVNVTDTAAEALEPSATTSIGVVVSAPVTTRQ